jgi:hypothetical protein
MKMTSTGWAGGTSAVWLSRVAPPAHLRASLFVALPWLLACGSTPAGDVPEAGASGIDAGGSADASARDAGPEASVNTFADAAPPDGGKLASGDSLSVREITSDGYVVYSDDAAGMLYAVPLAGGASVAIASLGSKFWVTGVGTVVFAWSGVGASNVGTLHVWSSSAGSHVLSTASLGLAATSSSDGSQVLYLDNVDAAAQTGDVVLANADGSGPTRLLLAQQLTGCVPQLGFAGSFVLASHCDVPRNAGPSSIISSFPSPGWARIDLASAAANLWSVDAQASRVLVSTGSGVEAVPIGGGSPVMVDPAGFLGELINGGLTAIYSTTAHALRRSPLVDPLPVTLVPTFGGFYGISPDETSVLFFQDFGTSGAGVYLASATQPSTPVTLWPQLTAALVGDPFTADSRFALYATGVDPQSGVGTLTAASVEGGAPGVLGTDAWSDWSATGTSVVFVDNYVSTGGLRFGRADIEWMDLSQTAKPTRVVAGADAVMALSPARDLVVYSWSAQPGENAGIFAVRLP